MATNPRILTFNFHEPYLCLMAKTGFHFFVGQYADPPLSRVWQTNYRPIPANVTLLDQTTWQRDLMAGRFDVAIAHNEANALNISKAPCAKLLVCHNRRKFLNTTAKGNQEEALRRFEVLLARLQEQFAFIFISESKRDDYGVPGKVILPGIDAEEYGGYTGTIREVLRVGNMMRERDLMFDVDFQEQVCKNLPNRIVGDNPPLPGSRAAASFGELLDTFRTLRCLLHVTREDWEDGYNLAMLEALACGMPVVALANRTSPLTDGKDGFVSYEAGVLRKRVEELLADLDLAQTIGARGRETVAAKFPLTAFTDKWREAIETAIEENARRQARPKLGQSAAENRPNVLMHYLSSPITTGRYFETAARKTANVVTAGFRCPEDVLSLWGFGNDVPDYPPHEIDLPLRHTFKDVARRLPEGFVPNAYLWIDSGPKEAPADIDIPGMVKICYLIDTHIAPELRMAMARPFDLVFLAQKAQVPDFIQAGIRNVAWLPLACAPELHNLPPMERHYDVACICNPRGDHNDRRRNIMTGLAERFPNNRIGQCWPEEMARVYAQSKIVVNACINKDINMRVFEAMASGALLITDEAIGLDDLFEDGKHLVVYHDDEALFGLVAKYLADDQSRERIAAAGKALVLAKHTYDHRFAEIITSVASEPNRDAGFKGESRYMPGGYFRSRRPEIVRFIPRSARRVLDIGCGAGEFGGELKRQGVPEVTGIELDPRACALARQLLDNAIEGNIETMELPFDDGYFDCIVFGDVIEHLVEPAAALKRVARVLAPDGAIIASIPNVQFYEVVNMLINGYWRYEDVGILDHTHLRFFTASGIQDLIAQAGLDAVTIEPLMIVPEDTLPRDANGMVSLSHATIGPLDDIAYRDYRTYQFAVIAVKPGVDRLAKARAALAAQENESAYILAHGAYGVDATERCRIMASAVGRLGNLDEAEELYKSAIELRPGDLDLKANLGTLYIAMNRHADAKKLLLDVMRQDPKNDRARGALGLIYLTEGDKERAYEAFRVTLEANFEHHPLIPHLLQTAEEIGRLSEIEDLVRRFADFYPGKQDLAYAYAALLNKLGRKIEARDRLETLLLFAPHYKAARDLLDALGEPDA